MKIAIDARELVGRRTGVGRYLDELLRAWAAGSAYAEDEFVLCAPERIDLEPYSGLRVTQEIADGHGVLWEQMVLRRLLRRIRPDVLLAPGYSAPLWCRVPVVLVVHDVSFARYPEWFSWSEGARRRTFTRLAARQASTVVTVSNFSKHEIETFLDVDPRRTTVVHNGVTPVSARLRTEPGRADAPVVLYVGSVFNRRHVPELIDAVGLLARRHPDVSLEVVGDNRTTPTIDLAGHASAAGIGDRIRLRAYVSEAELALSYRRARAFAFLSEYEGFGLTPLEALSAGVPIVVADHPITREVYGEAAIFAASLAPASVAAALELALFDEHVRRRTLDAAGPVLARYSWAEAAARVHTVLAAAASPATA